MHRHVVRTGYNPRAVMRECDAANGKTLLSDEVGEFGAGRNIPQVDLVSLKADARRVPQGDKSEHPFYS